MTLLGQSFGEFCALHYLFFYDMYVEYRYSCETLGLLANAKSWQTNQYEHNGLRVDGEHILEQLIELADSI